jgi:hypothetical protein
MKIMKICVPFFLPFSTFNFQFSITLKSFASKVFVLYAIDTLSKMLSVCSYVLQNIFSKKTLQLPPQF